MKSAPIPDNEESRLRALHALLLLDTPPEERFDRITEFARFEFDVPIALISLIDRDRQWFKSATGISECETSRDISFCGHAILQNEIMIVEDATQDDRFHDNPLVTGAPYIRFYAGVPLKLKFGVCVGTLCLIDRVPKNLDSTDLSILQTLGNMVVAELESNLTENLGY